MPLDMQAKLLRVLQERTVVRLGGAVERPVNTRVIATTHRDLDAQVRDGTFRLDLLYRLRVLHVHLPPLRDRGTDIVQLSKVFLHRVAEQQNKTVRDFAPQVLNSLLSYSWPGNIRELANVIEREVSLLSREVPLLESLQTPLRAGQSVAPASIHSQSNDSDDIIEPLSEVERRAFLRALERCDGNVPRAAQALRVSKVTFYAKLRQWGLHPKDIAADILKRGGISTSSDS
jgi:DNA-binding NtrC family response regulator